MACVFYQDPYEGWSATPGSRHTAHQIMTDTSCRFVCTLDFGGYRIYRALW